MTTPKPKRWSVKKADHEAVMADLREQLSSALGSAYHWRDAAEIRSWVGAALTVAAFVIGLALGAWAL